MSKIKPSKIKLSTWESPVTHYPLSKHGRASLEESPYARGSYRCYMQRGFLFFQATKRLPVRALIIDNKMWMVDDPPHWWAMEEHATHYEGHVLVAGLGMGMIVHALYSNPKVQKITVVELEQDVIDLISPHLPSGKTEIVSDDFYRLEHPLPKIDGVFFDLFVGKGQELLPHAIRAFSQLKELYPAQVIRVHGFPQSMLEHFSQAIAATKNVDPAVWQRLADEAKALDDSLSFL